MRSKRDNPVWSVIMRQLSMMMPGMRLAMNTPGEGWMVKSARVGDRDLMDGGVDLTNVRALAEGEQLLTLRKGGVREENKHFKLVGDKFFLYPTFDHQQAGLVRDGHRRQLQPVRQPHLRLRPEPPVPVTAVVPGHRRHLHRHLLPRSHPLGIPRPRSAWAAQPQAPGCR